VSLLACSWLSPPRPGFRRRFAPGAPANGSRGARPVTFRSGPSAARRLLQPPQPASTPARPPDPRPGQFERALARAARRPRFREARRPHRHARPKPRVTMTVPAPTTGGDPRRSSSDPSGRACAPPGWAFVEPVGRQSSLHGPGAPLFSRGASLRASPLRATGGEFFPNPIRSDTSRHGTAAPPAGDSGAALYEGRSLRSSLSDPTKGRITRPSAKRAEIRRTRSAFHR